MSDLRHGSARAATAVAVAVAVALAAFGLVRGTWAAGGSDSSCYALMAAAVAGGHLQPTSALAVEAPWPDASRTLAPGGFLPSPVREDAAVPVCAPGLSVLMAPLAARFGLDAIFWLVPLAGAMLVLSSYALATRLAGGLAGVTAAILTAASPIVLFQVVQPMNDVVTAGLWLAALAAPHPAVSGVLAGLAILVRPNLAPLVLVAAALPFVLPRSERPWRALAMFAAAAVPGVATLLWLNRALYGSAFASGYGDVSVLFSLSHVADNARNFARAVFETQHLVPALALLAPVVLAGEARRLALLLLLAAATVVAIYLPYRPFPEWWYLRFLMPALVLLLVLASAVAERLATRTRMRGLIPLAAVLVAVLGIRAAADRQAFQLQAMEGRYRAASALVRDRLPPNAVLITVWQSGSVRFHAGREAVLWDSLDPAWLDRAVAWLQARGTPPYLLFERREEAEFRARFRDHAELGALDWPPRFDLNRVARIYDPADRARYLAGESYATEQVR